MHFREVWGDGLHGTLKRLAGLPQQPPLMIEHLPGGRMIRPEIHPDERRRPIVFLALCYSQEIFSNLYVDSRCCGICRRRQVWHVPGKETPVIY